MLLTEKSMVEQLKLTNRVISKRKELFGIQTEDEALLSDIKPFIEERIDTIVGEFYQRQLQYSEIEIVIGDADTLSRLKNSMKFYVMDLFSGVYDEHYVTSRLRVGKVHKRIGVSPTLYMAAVRILWDLLAGIIENDYQFPDNRPGEKKTLLQSLSKILMFDVQLVFETYTGSLVYEVEKAKQELENYSKDLEEVVAARTKELEQLSRYDSLTGLLNQRSFYEQLRIDISQSIRRSDSLALVYFDLNDFKALNDSQGHLIGDSVLKSVGESVISIMRAGSFGARYGGDEFCLILPSASDNEAKIVCRRLVNLYVQNQSKFDVSFSMGIYQTGPEQFLNFEELVKQADLRMYRAKQKSKNKRGFWVCDTNDDLEDISSYPVE